jgi:gamma-glutamylcyclotransferase (GGCT)/AIG2-like uncharacterized protein YtfP
VSESPSIALFSYGTLRQLEVQLANYGRLLEGEADALLGYRLVPVEITDPDVVRLSGKAVHTIAAASDRPADRIAGVVYRLSEPELDATDAYEADAYARVETTLESGRSAWVYVRT